MGEYGTFLPYKHAAERLGVKSEEVRRLVDRALISSGLEPESSYETKGASFRFTGISGLLSLDKNRWIEIIPKFIGETKAEWREDFLWVVGKTSSDGINYSSSIPSSSAKSSSLYDVIAKIWCDEFEANDRKPIRRYRQQAWRSFNIDGEIKGDLTEAANEEGFLQGGIALTKQTLFNASTGGGGSPAQEIHFAAGQPKAGQSGDATWPARSQVRPIGRARITF